MAITSLRKSFNPSQVRLCSLDIWMPSQQDLEVVRALRRVIEAMPPIDQRVNPVEMPPPSYQRVYLRDGKLQVMFSLELQGKEELWRHVSYSHTRGIVGAEAMNVILFEFGIRTDEPVLLWREGKEDVEAINIMQPIEVGVLAF